MFITHFLGFRRCANKKIAILLTISICVIKNFQENHSLSTPFLKADRVNLTEYLKTVRLLGNSLDF